MALAATNKQAPSTRALAMAATTLLQQFCGVAKMNHTGQRCQNIICNNNDCHMNDLVGPLGEKARNTPLSFHARSIHKL
eukprot:3829194-Amphidinium_carterae.1